VLCLQIMFARPLALVALGLCLACIPVTRAFVRPVHLRALPSKPGLSGKNKTARLIVHMPTDNISSCSEGTHSGQPCTR
jgi:hypothetical protein